MKRMGRKKLHKTSGQVAKQKARWAEDHNRRRREKYAKDKAYREEVKRAARDYARLNRGAGGSDEDKTNSCIRALADVENLGTPRAIDGNGIVRTLSSTELAKAVGLSHVVVMHKWQRSGRFPKPQTRARIGRTHADVYTLDEAIKLLQIMKRHFMQASFLKETDTKTITALRAVMN